MDATCRQEKIMSIVKGRNALREQCEKDSEKASKLLNACNANTVTERNSKHYIKTVCKPCKPCI